jgi:hypothetical protein
MRIDFLTKSIEVASVKFPRLGDSYYTTLCVERNIDLPVSFPWQGEFKFRLTSPEVLGLKPEKVTGIVEIGETSALLKKVDIAWPYAQKGVSLKGGTGVDLLTGRLSGQVDGAASQEAIRPLLEALDVPIALEYIDCFTEVKDVIPSRCLWDVNLKNSDMNIVIDLAPGMSRYRKIPVDGATGKIDVSGWTRGTNFNFRTKIGPLCATDRKGRVLKGTLVAEGSRYGYTRLLIDAKSNWPYSDLLTVSEVLGNGVLDGVSCDGNPEVTVKGVLATQVDDQRSNNLSGKCSFPACSFFTASFSEAQFDYSYVGCELAFSNIIARTLFGADVSGTARLSLPGLTYDAAKFEVEGKYVNGSAKELANFLGMKNVTSIKGDSTVEFSLACPLNSSCAANLNGKGRIEIKDGYLSQLKLFAGLTEFLSEKVPGVAFVVNQSGVSADFTIEDGVVKSDNIFVEGAVFSISGKGAYNMATGDVAAVLRVQFFKKESFLSSLINPVTWAFSKLFMEVKLGGKISDPEWDYVSVIDRVL